jgi:hypothetical protein
MLLDSLLDDDESGGHRCGLLGNGHVQFVGRDHAADIRQIAAREIRLTLTASNLHNNPYLKK